MAKRRLLAVLSPECPMRLHSLVLCTALLTNACDRETRQGTPPTNDTTGAQAAAPTTAQTPASADAPRLQSNTPIEALVDALADKDTAQAALDILIGRGATAIPALQHAALHHEAMTARGWAVHALVRMDDPAATTSLELLTDSATAPKMVKGWAIAGLIAKAHTWDQLLALGPKLRQHPEVRRPFRQKIATLEGRPPAPGPLIQAMAIDSALVDVLAPLLEQEDPRTIAEVMLTHPDDPTRRLAAGLIGGIVGKDPAERRQLIAAYSWARDLDQIPWAGGALYVPALDWSRSEARALMGHMVAWHLYCDKNGLIQEQRQIHNNIRSVGLYRPAGLGRSPAMETPMLLRQWAAVQGRSVVVKLLAQQGVSDVPRYTVAVQ